MVNKAPKQCASLFKMIMTEEAGCFKAAPSLQRHRGAFAQPKAWLLCISHQRHQTWQARPFFRYQLHCWTQGPWISIAVYETLTTNSHDYSIEWTISAWARIQNLSNIIVIQCPNQGKKRKMGFPLLIISWIIDRKYNQTGNLGNWANSITWDGDCVKGSKLLLNWPCGETVLSVTNSSKDVMMFPAPNPGSHFGCFSNRPTGAKHL